MKPRYTGQRSKRKVKGFNYYIMSNDKLKKSERNSLIRMGNSYISEMEDVLDLPLEHLDNKWGDWELLEHWNNLYDSYGYLIDSFKDKWEKEHFNENAASTDTKFNVFKELQLLKQKVERLELEISKLKVKKWLGQ